MKKELLMIANTVLSVAKENEGNGYSFIGQRVPSALQATKEPYPAKLVGIKEEPVSGTSESGTKWQFISCEVEVEGLTFNASCNAETLEKLTGLKGDNTPCKVLITENAKGKFASIVG